MAEVVLSREMESKKDGKMKSQLDGKYYEMERWKEFFTF